MGMSSTTVLSSWHVVLMFEILSMAIKGSRRPDSLLTGPSCTIVTLKRTSLEWWGQDGLPLAFRTTSGFEFGWIASRNVSSSMPIVYTWDMTWQPDSTCSRDLRCKQAAFKLYGILLGRTLLSFLRNQSEIIIIIWSMAWIRCPRVPESGSIW